MEQIQKRCPCRAKIISHFGSISCSKCQRVWHKDCVKIKITVEDSLFECPKCIIYNQDPLNKVELSLIDPMFLEKAKKYAFRVYKPDETKPVKASNFIELRMLKLVRFESYKKNRMASIPLRQRIQIWVYYF